MTLDEAIIARKSIRSYDMEELEPELIDGLVDFLSDLTVPDNTIDWNFDILPIDDMRKLLNGIPRLQAPHYLIIRSEKQKNCLQNAGYIGEMAVLWLTAHGIASCWQSSLEPEKDYEDVLPFIAAIGFGRSQEPFRKSPAEISKKKKLSAVAFGDMKSPRKEIMELTWMAPSCMNMEPVRYLVDTHRIHIYRKNNRLFKFNQFNYFNCLDVGVAMAHMEVAAKKYGYRVIFERLSPEPDYRKELYQASAHLIKEESNA
jgi:nitroreductase